MSRVAPLCFALVLLSSCTLVGIAISPITGPVDAVRLAIAHPVEAKNIWIVALAILCSPIAGMCSGLIADTAIVDQWNFDAIPGILRPWESIIK